MGPSSISCNEVRYRALRIAREWKDATDEERDKQTFWNEFFEVFGIPRKSVGMFEKSVAMAEGGYGLSTFSGAGQGEGDVRLQNQETRW